MDRTEIVRRIYDPSVTRTGHFPLDSYAEEAEFDASAVGNVVTRHQPEAVRLRREYVECFEGFRIKPVELIEAGPDQMVAVVRDGGRVKGSAAEIHNEFSHVWTFGPDNKVTGWATFPTKGQALEYAGRSRSP